MKKHPDQVTQIVFEPKHDSRGQFTRIFCTEEFSKFNLNFQPKQINVNSSKHKGTIRGLHFQFKPHSEAKFVRVIEGSIFDVCINLNPGPNFLNKESFRLSKKDDFGILIPKGFAHGFQTLEDNTSVEYIVDEYYKSDYEAGLLWNDVSLGIEWPVEVTEISPRDLKHEALSKDRIEYIKQKLS